MMPPCRRIDGKSNAAYYAAWNRARKLEYMARAGDSCMDCGLTDRSHPEKFDFDHRDGRDNPSRASIMNMAVARREKEFLQCDLICANCHRTRTALRAESSRLAELE